MPRFNVVAMKSMVFSVDAPTSEAAHEAVDKAMRTHVSPLNTDGGWDIQQPEIESEPFGEPDIVVEESEPDVEQVQRIFQPDE